MVQWCSRTPPTLAMGSGDTHPQHLPPSLEWIGGKGVCRSFAAPPESTAARQEQRQRTRCRNRCRAAALANSQRSCCIVAAPPGERRSLAALRRRSFRLPSVAGVVPCAQERARAVLTSGGGAARLWVLAADPACRCCSAALCGHAPPSGGQTRGGEPCPERTHEPSPRSPSPDRAGRGR